MTNKRYRDFIIIFKNPNLNGFSNPKDYLEKINKSENLKSLLKYLIFQRETDFNSETYYRMYFEFTNNMSVKRIREDFFNGINVDIEPRTESQEEVIKKCSDLTDKPSVYGESRRGYKNDSRVNRSEIDKITNLKYKDQISYIIEQAEKGNYKTLQDIQKDFPILRFTHDTLLQKILNSVKSSFIENINKSKVPAPCKVIWVFGEAGDGKTVWTHKHLKQLGYSYEEVCEISPPSMVYDKLIWFNAEDQFKKVLIINEADKEFPKHNNLIAYIDRKIELPVKGEKSFRNNFELIIINSIYRPEEVFKYLGKKNAKQILRRIFKFHKKSSVYHIIPNLEQLAQTEREDFKEMNDLEFENWYQPSVKKIDEVDWSIFDKN